MNTTAVIAWNTFLEAIREKALYLLAGFAAFLFLISKFLAPLALGEGRRVTIDLGMMAISIFGLLIIVFVGHALVYRELERGTVAFLFCRPVGRGPFVVGKFAGLALVVLLAVAGMGAILALVLLASHYPLGGEIIGALLLTLLELWILAATAILFASIASPILAGLFVVGAWVIGNSVGAISECASLIAGAGLPTIARAALWLLPRLDLYDGASLLVHGHPFESQVWLWAVSYAVLYIIGTLLLARAAFGRRALVG